MGKTTITDETELQYRMLYSLVVAGKSAKFARAVMKKLMEGTYSLPFDVVRQKCATGKLRAWLEAAGTGNYSKMEKAFREIVLLWDQGLDLRTCTPEELETVHGLGRKTSRFFIVWTRENANVAALDVHVLRWLREKGYNAPRNTPASAKKYAALEQAFLKEAAALGKTPQELDQEIWSAGAGEDWEAQAD